MVRDRIPCDLITAARSRPKRGSFIGAAHIHARENRLGVPAPRILVVDDEPEVRSALRRGPESESRPIVESGSVASLFERFHADHAIDLATLDPSLGQDDGLALAGRLRAVRNVPIVMITARMTPIDRLTGLENDTDDYIVKPFHIREVLLRIRAVLRRYALERAQDPGNAANGTEAEASAATRFAFEAGVLDVISRGGCGRRWTARSTASSQGCARRSSRGSTRRNSSGPSGAWVTSSPETCGCRRATDRAGPSRRRRRYPRRPRLRGEERLAGAVQSVRRQGGSTPRSIWIVQCMM